MNHHMTKKEARAQRLAWDQARNEERVVSFRTLGRMVMYPTIEARNEALHEADRAGIKAIIVPAPGSEDE